MSTTTTTQITPTFAKLELRTGQGIVYRNVSTAPPRECSADEVPVIDLSPMFSDLNARKSLAKTIKEAAENTGFFYIKNHGINERIVEAAHAQAKAFFNLSEEEKERVNRSQSKYFNGWHRRQGPPISSSTALDNMEQFSWSYNPKYDPEVLDVDAISEDVRSHLPGEEFIWEGTQQMPNYKRDCIRYWQENVQLARRLLRVFALGLDLPETYFDNVTEHPGR